MTTDNGAGVKIEGLKELLARFDNLEGDLSQAVRAGIGATALQVCNQAKKNLRDNRSIATGQLRQSGMVSEVEEGVFEVSFTGGHSKSTNYDGYYAACVEFGTRAHPGWPISKEGIENLKAWVRKKGIGRNNTIQANGNLKFGARLKDDEEKSIAYAIASHIRYHGTKAHPFLYPAFKDKIGNLTGNIQKYVNRYLRALK